MRIPNRPTNQIALNDIRHTSRCIVYGTAHDCPNDILQSLCFDTSRFMTNTSTQSTDTISTIRIKAIDHVTSPANN